MQMWGKMQQCVLILFYSFKLGSQVCGVKGTTSEGPGPFPPEACAKSIN